MGLPHMLMLAAGYRWLPLGDEDQRHRGGVRAHCCVAPTFSTEKQRNKGAGARGVEVGEVRDIQRAAPWTVDPNCRQTHLPRTTFDHAQLLRSLLRSLVVRVYSHHMNSSAHMRGSRA